MEKNRKKISAHGVHRLGRVSTKLICQSLRKKGILYEYVETVLGVYDRVATRVRMVCGERKDF